MIAETPYADELWAHPDVRAAFAAAWTDSFADDSALRHEEGGWIDYHPSTGGTSIRRFLPGGNDELLVVRPLPT